MHGRKQVAGGRAGIGTVVFGVGLGVVLTALCGLRYGRTPSSAGSSDPRTNGFAPTSRRAELLAGTSRLQR